MDFKKFLVIVAKDVHALFMDRAALMITIITPLILTFVIGLAFSGVSGGNSPISHIPVVVVNNDTGTSLGIQNINYGDLMTEAYKQVGELLDVQIAPDEATARTLLQTGKVAAAIIIPADFSEAISPIASDFGKKKVNIQVIRDPGATIPGEIVMSIVRQMTNGFMNANIAVYAAGQANSDPLFLATQASAIAQDVAAVFSSRNVPIMTLITNGEQQEKQQGSTLNLLQYFAPAMAIFFLNFAMTFGVVTIIEERDNGTLQRLIVSPTRRLTILAGKLAATFVNGVLQISILVIATSVIAPLLGNNTPVWGTNLPALLVLIPVVVAGSVGLGTLLAGLAKTQQQAAIYASALLTIMGLIGGAFTAGTDGPLSKLTVNYWATNAFAKLAQTGDLTAVLPNIAALLVIFVVCFGTGVLLFNRRLDI
jgi:ABC-2 type transport system permease protein